MAQPMYYYAFQVKGWLNEQTIMASSEEEAIQEAANMAAGEENITCLRKVSRTEANAIMRSWG